MKRKYSLLERVFSKIKKNTSGCWIWTGAKSHGYGVVRIDGRKGMNVLVHRLMLGLPARSWKPGDLEPHHKCENPACVRPSHLKMVTHKENMLLSRTPAAHANAMKRVCIRGHRFTPNNTILYHRIRATNSCMERICRKCRRLTMRQWRNR